MSSTRSDSPVIISMWHGQHFLMPFLRRTEDRAKVLVSRHRDGEVNAIAAQRLGVGAIRGSGRSQRRLHRKGGVGAFRRDAGCVGARATTWRSPPTCPRSRASPGSASSSSRARPAGRSFRSRSPPADASARQLGPHRDQPALRPRRPVAGQHRSTCRADADAASLEAARQAIEARLNAITARAYAHRRPEQGRQMRPWLSGCR